MWAANGLENFKSSLRSWQPYKDRSQTLNAEQWERIVNVLGLTELSADDPAPQRATVVDNPSKNSGIVPRSIVRNDSVPAQVLDIPQAQEPSSPPALDPAALVPQNKFKLRSVPLAAGITICIAAVLGSGWFTLRDKTVVSVVTEQTKPARATPAVSAEAPLPGTTYRPAQETAVAVASGLTPLDRSNCPYSLPVKGNINREGERIFHVVGQKYYEQTKPENCFSSAEAALAEGFRASLR